MEMASHPSLGHPYLESINIRYPTNQKGKKFSSEIACEFQKKIC